jgi:hypothetical protein
MRFGIPGAVGRAYREGRNLADAAAVRGTMTWQAFLDADATAAASAAPRPNAEARVSTSGR